MITTIDGSYSRDLQCWVSFGTAKMENAIKCVPKVSGLVLSGRLTEEDCSAICAKKQSLQLLDLSHALLPSGVTRERFLDGAPLLTTLRWPGDEA